MKVATLQRAFAIQRVGPDAIRISGKGTGLGIGSLLIVAILSFSISVPVGSGFSKYVLGQDGDVLVLTVFLTSIAIVVGLQRLKTQSFCFDLTAKGIVKNGVLYPRAEISEVLLDNPSSEGSTLASSPLDSWSIDRKMVAINAAGEGLLAGSVALGAKVNWRISFRHGKRVVRLATSLNENSAYDLFLFLTERANPA